ncbi:hypothetical protein [Pontitalea aquivivens]|uniref:hypothetical protein n=1 Tax=Pontitalea aquivivens TaxID=3388663 RepID=UPI0039707DD4
MTIRYFLYGTLRHPPLLARVLGRAADGVAAPNCAPNCARIRAAIRVMICRRGRGQGVEALAPRA